MNKGRLGRLIGFLLWKEIKSKTFLNLIYGDDPPSVVRRLFFGLRRC